MVEFVNLPKLESACPSPGGPEALKSEANTQQLESFVWHEHVVPWTMHQIQLLSAWRGRPRLAVITAPTTGSFSCGDGHGEQENKHGGCNLPASAQLVQTKENGFF